MSCHLYKSIWMLVLIFTLAGIICNVSPVNARNSSENADASQDAQKLVRKVLNARKKLQSGEIILEKTCFKSEHGEDEENIRTHYSMLFKPEMFRIKKYYTSLNSSTVSASHPYVEVIWNKGRTIRVPFEDRFMVTDIEKQVIPLSSYGLFQPWLLGICPRAISLLKNFDFDITLLLSDKATDVVIVSDFYDNQAVQKLSYTVHEEGIGYHEQNDIWIAPHMDYSVLRSESVSRYSNDKIIKTIFTTKPKLYDKFWFSEEIRVVEYVNDIIVNDEVVKVVKAAFNQSISDLVFELESLDIPTGRQVSRDGTLKYWDGQSLSDTYIAPEVDFTNSHSNRKRWGYILALNAALCAYIAFRLYVQSKKRHAKFNSEEEEPKK